MLHEIYTTAWRLGLKTTYYLRTSAATQIEKSTLDASKYGYTQKREYEPGLAPASGNGAAPASNGSGPVAAATAPSAPEAGPSTAESNRGPRPAACAGSTTPTAKPANNRSTA